MLVAQAMQGKDPDLVIAALLHDAVEDQEVRSKPGGRRLLCAPLCRASGFTAKESYMKTQTKKREWTGVIGKRGSWLGKVRYSDGHTESLPVVYDVRTSQKPFRFHHPGWTPELPKHADFAKKIRELGRVILVESVGDWKAEEWRFGKVLGVYDVANVSCDNDGTRFDFVKRYKKAD